MARYPAIAARTAPSTSPGGYPFAWKMVGSWSLMTGTSPLSSTSFGKISSPLLFPRSFSRRFDDPLVHRGVLDAAQQVPWLERLVPELQRLQLAVPGHGLAVGADAGRDHVPGRRNPSARCPGRPTTKLAARRFTSHSHGAGSVSSRSLMEKMILRSGVANPPKLERWASPQHCTWIPGRGRGRQVGRHGQGRPAVEGERRLDHAPVAQGEQFRQAPLLRREDHLDRVLPAGRGLPGCVRLPGAGLSQRLARRVPLGRG